MFDVHSNHPRAAPASLHPGTVSNESRSGWGQLRMVPTILCLMMFLSRSCPAVSRSVGSRKLECMCVVLYWYDLMYNMSMLLFEFLLQVVYLYEGHQNLPKLLNRRSPLREVHSFKNLSQDFHYLPQGFSERSKEQKKMLKKERQRQLAKAEIAKKR